MDSSELRRILKNAEILEKPTHDWVYTDNEMSGLDGYFVLDDIDYYFEKDLPFFVFDCDEHKWEGINVDDVLDNEFENWYDGAADQIVDYVELVKFIKQWNAKQQIREYQFNQERIIILDRERFDRFLDNVD